MSRFKVTFGKDFEQRFEKNNLFFLKYSPYSYFNRDGEEVDASKWVSVDRDLNVTLEARFISHNDRDYHLCIIELDSKTQNPNGGGSLEYQVHTVSLKNESDLKRIFTLYAYHMQRPEKDYACVELLWLLNAYAIDTAVFKNALGHVDKNTAQLVCNGLTDFGRCLSVSKQNQLKEIAAIYGYTFHVYSPSVIDDALARIGADWRYAQSNLNVYDAVDKVISLIRHGHHDNTGNNMFMLLDKWFAGTEAFGDYSKLANLYALVSEPRRLAMLKRWFHDIRLGNTTFNPELLEQFKDNRFANFVRFRHCIETPREAVVLTVPLFADSILTLYRSCGANFQSFDGVLDFAITHCDTSHPAIDFKMDRFLPTCNGGTQRNERFAGFIDYALVRKLDESRFNHGYVLQEIRRVLDNFAQRKPYTACRWNPDVPLTKEQLQNCLKDRELPNNENPFGISINTYRLECAVTRQYYDKWIIKKNNNFDFRVMFEDGVNFSQNETEVDISMVSTGKFINFLRSIPKRFTELENGEFVVPSYRQRTLLLQLVEQFSTIERMRIYPNKNVYAGLQFDIFGIRKRILEENGEKDVNINSYSSPKAKKLAEEYAEEEAKEVHARVLKSLKTNFKLGEFNEEGNYFETSYDRSLLDDIMLKYFFKKTASENIHSEDHSFLIEKTLGKFKPFCSPQLEEVKNDILDFPYFWCRGNECFHNCLGEQTLAEVDDWQSYTMFHLIEIIGFKKLRSTEAGYEPHNEVIQFIAVTNKAMQKFRRLKCRECGHLLFTERSIGFNRNNYYACANPNCAGFNVPVYLSYCFKCKKGLIDSRDSARCPNGWYICPTCLSCCDDAQYERLAQRYVNSRRPIPSRIEEKLGQGHNDKDIHFCPKCGTQIILFQDDHGDYHHGCPQCREQYNF